MMYGNSGWTATDGRKKCDKTLPRDELHQSREIPSKSPSTKSWKSKEGCGSKIGKY